MFETAPRRCGERYYRMTGVGGSKEHLKTVVTQMEGGGALPWSHLSQV